MPEKYASAKVNKQGWQHWQIWPCLRWVFYLPMWWKWWWFRWSYLIHRLNMSSLTTKQIRRSQTTKQITELKVLIQFDFWELLCNSMLDWIKLILRWKLHHVYLFSNVKGFLPTLLSNDMSTLCMCCPLVAGLYIVVAKSIFLLIKIKVVTVAKNWLKKKRLKHVFFCLNSRLPN